MPESLARDDATGARGGRGHGDSGSRHTVPRGTPRPGTVTHRARWHWQPEAAAAP
jgi:hypothetical protein